MVPNDKNVTRELYGIVSFIPSLSNILSSANAGGRDKKFAEFEEQYHGKIDEEIAKKILATPPINWGMTDGKVTSSKLMENMGMIIHMGNSDGTERVFYRVPRRSGKNNGSSCFALQRMWREGRL